MWWWKDKHEQTIKLRPKKDISTASLINSSVFCCAPTLKMDSNRSILSRTLHAVLKAPDNIVIMTHGYRNQQQEEPLNEYIIRNGGLSTTTMSAKHRFIISNMNMLAHSLHHFSLSLSEFDDVVFLLSRSILLRGNGIIYGFKTCRRSREGMRSNVSQPATQRGKRNTEEVTYSVYQ